MPPPSYNDRTTCVTGGAGFIGSHLVTRLLEAGSRVRVLDDFSSGRPENIAPVRSSISLFEGSILDASALAEAFAGVQVVFHHAARVSVSESLEDPKGYCRTNVDGTLAVLEAARAAGVERVIYAGSCSAYGDLPGLPKQEEDPVHPGSPYAATKLAGEEFVAAYPASFGLDTGRLRYFNVYGPRQAHDSPYAAVVPKFIEAIRSGGEPVIFGDGHQTRDFVHVDDVAQANLLAGTADGPLGGAVFNIGSGSRRSIVDILGEILRAMEVDVSPRHEPARGGEVRDSEASIERARTRLGFSPNRSFPEAIAGLVHGTR